MLGFLGGQAIEEPYTDASVFFMFIYLSYVPAMAIYANYTRYVMSPEEFNAMYMSDYEWDAMRGVGKKEENTEIKE